MSGWRKAVPLPEQDIDLAQLEMMSSGADLYFAVVLLFELASHASAWTASAGLDHAALQHGRGST